jgi:hypothetical protein
MADLISEIRSKNNSPENKPVAYFSAFYKEKNAICFNINLFRYLKNFSINI